MRAGHNVHHACWQVGGVEDLIEIRGRQRVSLACHKHHAVAHRNGGCHQRDEAQEWGLVRAEPANHAHRFMHGQGHAAHRHGFGGAVIFVGPGGIGEKAADGGLYLFLAAVLGSALIGIEDGMTPPDPITGNSYDQKLPQVSSTWEDAIDAFEQSKLARRIFDPQLVDNLIRTKRQEMAHFAEMTPEEQIDHYLDLV